MKRNYKVDFDKKTLEINFDNETHKIDLTEGDADDNWNSFETKDGKIYDVNAFFEDDEKPTSKNFTVVLYEIISTEHSENYSNPIVLKGSKSGRIKKYFQ